jgi:hypothetical protein
MGQVKLNKKTIRYFSAQFQTKLVYIPEREKKFEGLGGLGATINRLSVRHVLRFFKAQ